MCLEERLELTVSSAHVLEGSGDQQRLTKLQEEMRPALSTILSPWAAAGQTGRDNRGIRRGNFTGCWQDGIRGKEDSLAVFGSTCWEYRTER